MKKKVIAIKKIYTYNINEGYSKWRKSNGQGYLEVYGTDYYTLGYLEGEELSNQIIAFKNRIGLHNFKFLLKTYTYKKLVKLALKFEPFIPQIYVDEMKGIADAIMELEYKDRLLQNCFLDIFYGILMPKYAKINKLRQYEFGCTSLGVLTPSGLMIDQNFDFPLFLKNIFSFVHAKTPHTNEIFSLRLGAQLSLPVGMISNGLSLRFNIVKNNRKGLITMSNSLKARISLERFKTVEKSFEYIMNYGGSSSGNLLISDNSKLIALEVVPEGYIREDISNIFVRSNTFISQLIQKYLINKNYSKKRQRYAETLLRDLYQIGSGFITDSDFLTILVDDPIICRTNIFKPMTLAFVTENYFRLGNPKKTDPGLVPINNIKINNNLTIFN